MMISTMPDVEKRIGRATQLAAQDEAARHVALLRRRDFALQQDAIRASPIRLPFPGSLERDLDVLERGVPPILRAMAATAPAQLAEEAGQLLAAGGAAIRSTLLEGWRAPSDRQFFAKAVLQPYAQWLSEIPVRPVMCTTGDADGGGRLLLYATCFTTWPYRRVRCAHCGEEDEPRLGYFHSPPFDHLRVDVCDTCKRYLKTVDLTRLGLAVPIVDEVAGAPLDVWARERGYEKIELNLVGL
jgi:hypothetical protein